MILNQLNKNEYPSYYEGYFSILNNELNLFEELEASLHYFIKFVQDIPMDKYDYRYQVGKWTIKEIIQHLIDVERVFSYRALRIARKDTTHLPGFDENLFADSSNGNSRHLKDLLTEFSLVRHATLALFKSFSKEDLTRIGIVSEQEISVRGIGFMIIAHQEHHKKIFIERYL